LLEIEVWEIRGVCSVFKKGDRIIIDPPKIVLEKTDAICIHALPSLLPYAVVLNEGIDPVKRLVYQRIQITLTSNV